MVRAYRVPGPRASPAGTEADVLEPRWHACHPDAVTAPDDLANGRLFAPLGRLAQEFAAVAYLDSRTHVLGMRHLAGAVSWLQLPIRQIARDALSFEARSVVLAHNHPSGREEASGADLAFTRRLALCLDALDVRLHDHLIVAGDRVTSLRSAGYL